MTYSQHFCLNWSFHLKIYFIYTQYVKTVNQVSAIFHYQLIGELYIYIYIYIYITTL